MTAALDAGFQRRNRFVMAWKALWHGKLVEPEAWVTAQARALLERYQARNCVRVHAVPSGNEALGSPVVIRESKASLRFLLSIENVAPFAIDLLQCELNVYLRQHGKDLCSWGHKDFPSVSIAPGDTHRLSLVFDSKSYYPGVAPTFEACWLLVNGDLVLSEVRWRSSTSRRCRSIRRSGCRRCLHPSPLPSPPRLRGGRVRPSRRTLVYVEHGGASLPSRCRRGARPRVVERTGRSQRGRPRDVTRPVRARGEGRSPASDYTAAERACGGAFKLVNAPTGAMCWGRALEGLGQAGRGARRLPRRDALPPEAGRAARVHRGAYRRQGCRRSPADAHCNARLLRLGRER